MRGLTLVRPLVLISCLMLMTSFTEANPLARPFRYLTRSAGKVDYWPRWSPDGKTVLFSRCDISSGCGGGAAAGVWNLFTVRLRGERPNEFLQLDGVSATRSNWLWTPDSSIARPIAFTAVAFGEPGVSGVYVVSSDGESVVRLATDPSIPFGYPSWFPDGSALTVEGQTHGSSGPFIDLISVPEGSLLQAETSPDEIWTGQSAISRDGSKLAFAGQTPIAGSQYDDNHNQIWLENLAARGVAPEAFHTGLHQLDPLQGRTPDWSPNDRFLIFESTRGCIDGNYAIFIEAADSGEAVQATDCRLNANHAVWSPDGRRFAFSAEFFSPAKQCAAGCRGIAIAPVPQRILQIGTAD
jgi:Tol biopolymer transport system component